MIGTVLRRLDLRAVLAVAFTAASIYLWVTASEVPPPLLAVTCLSVGNVLGYMGAVPVAVRPEAVALPYIPEEVT